jgi:hypothetical protein
LKGARHAAQQKSRERISGAAAAPLYRAAKPAPLVCKGAASVCQACGQLAHRGGGLAGACAGG